jgi:Arc/MetJ-type ribon-helix-helix transcriptional regulator
VELGATIDELRKMDDGRYKVVDEEYRDGLRDLLYRLARQRASQPIAAERSTLGAWYPADR